MNELAQATPRLTPLQVLRRHWWVAALCVPLCTAAGAGFATTQPTVHTAETRLSVGSGDISTFAIPGFPLAARDLAANYARLVQNNFNDKSFAPDGVVAIAASPIPESNVIRIEAQALSPEAATAAVDGAAAKLRADVKAAQTVNDPAKVKAEHEALSKKSAVAEALAVEADSALRAAMGDKESSSEKIETLRDKLAVAREKASVARLTAEAQSDLYRRLVAQPTSGARLNAPDPAKVVKNNRSSLLQRFSLLGFGLGLALALFIAMMVDRRGRRRQLADLPHPPRSRFLPGQPSTDDLPMVEPLSSDDVPRDDLTRSTRRAERPAPRAEDDVRRTRASRPSS